MDCYAKLQDDPARMVANPAKAQMRKKLASARAAVASARAAVASARAAVASAEQAAFARSQGGDSAEECSVTQAKAALADLKIQSKTIPATVALGEVRPQAMRLNDERERLHDTVRMATWNAEHALAAALRAHDARAEDEAHSLLAEAFSASVDLEVIGNKLHVRLEALSAPCRSRAIAALCVELNTTETVAHLGRRSSLARNESTRRSEGGQRARADRSDPLGPSRSCTGRSSGGRRVRGLRGSLPSLYR
jgi:hypothetical protein